jgi:hypothetical protein
MIMLAPDISPWRAALFPFFDKAEIAFTLFLIGLECSLVVIFDIQNGWIIPIGSYVGMVAVARTVLPSRLNFSSDQLKSVLAKLNEMNFMEIENNHFVPNLPRLLRWPRNIVVLSDSEEPRLDGPLAVLRLIHRELHDNDSVRRFR